MSKAPSKEYLAQNILLMIEVLHHLLYYIDAIYYQNAYTFGICCIRSTINGIKASLSRNPEFLSLDWHLDP